MTLSFAVTWDYRCPFARNAHEHILDGLAAGADWEVTFSAFSLDQTHVAEGEPDVWDDPSKAPALLAMQVGIAVRDTWPERFADVHRALFAARHDEARDIREEEVLRDVVARHGLDPDEVMAEVRGGAPLDTFRKEHEHGVADHQVFGVPTFVADGRAVFVRLMRRPTGDAGASVATMERVLDLATGWPDLNELKHTTIPR